MYQYHVACICTLWEERTSKKVQTAGTRADVVTIREFGKGKTKKLRTPTVPFRISAEEEVQNESRRRRRRRNC
jgi:hypothetical protein